MKKIKDFFRRDENVISSVFVSIIIPVYNAEIESLKKSIESCLSQTLSNIEIIVIDDGSTKEYIELQSLFDLKNIIYKKVKNKGSGNARNVGMKIAKGEYIAFLDSDDYFNSNDVLEKLYKTAIDKNINIVGGYSIFEKSKEFIYWSFKNYNNIFNDNVVKYKDCQFCYGFWSYIYKKSFILKNKLFFPNLKRFQDAVWLFDVMHSAKEFYAMNMPVYVYRERNILEHKWTKEALKDYFTGLDDLVCKSKKYGYFDLHTYFYRKVLFWEYPLYKNSKQDLNIDMTNKFKKLLSSFDYEIIKEIEPKIPILKTIIDFENTNMDLYKEYDY